MGNTYLSYASVNLCTLSHVRKQGVNFIHMENCWIVQLFLFCLNEIVFFFLLRLNVVFLLKRLVSKRLLYGIDVLQFSL